MSDTSVISSWYDINAAAEHSRLESGKLEFTITLQTILRSLPTNKPLRIADVGGGTGRYGTSYLNNWQLHVMHRTYHTSPPTAVELAQLGHSVTLLDISQSELDLAAQHAKSNNVTLDAIICADASNLPSASALPPSSFDAVLLLGPLYHLSEEHERITTLSNCVSLLKPSGLLFAAFLTKFGHLRGVARSDPARLSRERDFYSQYLKDGKYTRREGIFSHHCQPEEIRWLFGKLEEEEGLRLERLVACEGFLGNVLAGQLNGLDESAWEVWVDLLMRFSNDECALGASEHVLAVARRV